MDRRRQGKYFIVFSQNKGGIPIREITLDVYVEFYVFTREYGFGRDIFYVEQGTYGSPHPSLILSNPHYVIEGKREGCGEP